MSTTILAKIVSPDTAASLASFVPASTTGPATDAMWRGLATFSNAVLNGSRNAQLLISLAEVSDTKSTGTITFSGGAPPAAGHITTVAGVAFTARASADASVLGDYTFGATTAYTTSATNLAAKINAHPSLVGIVTAVSHLGVVTVLAGSRYIGSAGDALTLTTSLATYVQVSAATLASGASAASAAASSAFTVPAEGLVKSTSDTVTIGSVTLSAETSPTTAAHFLSSATPATAATNLKNCINANATLRKIVIATAASNVVTVTALVKGVLGNHIPVAAGGGVEAADWTGGVLFLAGGVEPAYITLDKS